jgi:gas vesicle protein
MAQTSDELRAQIERTRDDMGETVEALTYKADVPSRTKEWLGDKKDALAAKVGGAQSKVGELTPDGQEVTQQMSGLKRAVERNPLGLAIAGAAVGFVAGLLIPTTRIEDERIGPVADELKSTAADAGREAVERGKTVAQEAASTAAETAKETGREQSEELTESLKQRAREVSPTQETKISGT